MNTLIISVTATGLSLARIIESELKPSEVVMHKSLDIDILSRYDNIIFIGAMGICVRTILPIIANKHIDPAVVCVDSTGRFAISVLSGHVGGANDLAKHIASIIGAEPVITTQSDNSSLWTLDTIAKKYGWCCDASKAQLDKAIFSFVNGAETALILDTKDRGTAEMENTLPPHVKIYN